MFNETKKLLKAFMIADSYTDYGQTREALARFGDLANASFKKYFIQMVRADQPNLDKLIEREKERNDEFAKAYESMVKCGYPPCSRMNQVEPFTSDSLLFKNLLKILHKPMRLAESNRGILSRYDLQDALCKTIFKNNEGVIFKTIIDADSHDNRWLNRDYLEGVLGEGEDCEWDETNEWDTFYRQLTFLVEGERKTSNSEYFLLPSNYKGKGFHVEVINVEIETNRGIGTNVTFSLFGKVVGENEYQMISFYSTDIV